MIKWINIAIVLVLNIFLSVGIATKVCASSVAQITLSDLEIKADYVVLGKVIKIAQEDVRDHVTIKVDAYLKGKGSTEESYTFTLTSRGGLKDFDPELKKGDIGVFFLKKIEAGNITKAYWGSIALFPNSLYTLSSSNSAD